MEEMQEICTLNGDARIPIYLHENVPCMTAKIAKLIIKGEQEQTLICTRNPLQVESNASFLISWKSIGHWKDPLADMLGHWVHIRTKKSYFKVHSSNDITSVVEQEFGQEDTFLAQRFIYLHRESKDFHRVFVSIEDGKHQILPLMYFQYYFDSKEHPVFVTLSHGNAKEKNGVPFQKTKASVKSKK